MVLIRTAEIRLITGDDMKKAREKLLLLLKKIREMNEASSDHKHIYGEQKRSPQGVMSLSKLFEDLAAAQSLFGKTSK